MRAKDPRVTTLIRQIEAGAGETDTPPPFRRASPLFFTFSVASSLALLVWNIVYNAKKGVTLPVTTAIFTSGFSIFFFVDQVRFYAAPSHLLHPHTDCMQHQVICCIRTLIVCSTKLFAASAH
jgi:hypothetical protein